jgi:LemA protein
LVAALGKLFAVAENYPDLKANQNFLELQRELTNTEDRLQTARRFYNANVREYNQRVKQFPSVLVANAFHFEEAEFFEVDEATREAGAPQVDFGTAGGSGATPPDAGATTPPPPADDVPEPPGQPTPPNPTG